MCTNGDNRIPLFAHMCNNIGAKKIPRLSGIEGGPTFDDCGRNLYMIWMVQVSTKEGTWQDEIRGVFRKF